MDTVLLIEAPDPFGSFRTLLFYINTVHVYETIKTTFFVCTADLRSFIPTGTGGQYPRVR